MSYEKLGGSDTYVPIREQAKPFVTTAPLAAFVSTRVTTNIATNRAITTAPTIVPIINIFFRDLKKMLVYFNQFYQ